ncbi:MAG TPA: hypothetical protein VMW52_12540 [Phycisphaerae bacterium]|nr:hypothetical protein [Phycisphaerae bacterium]
MDQDTKDAIAAAVAEQIKAAQTELVKALEKTAEAVVAKAMEPVTAKVGELEGAAKTAAAKAAGDGSGGNGRDITAEAVKAIVADALKARDDADAAKGKKADADAKLTAARDKFAAEKLKDLPAVYRDKLPITDDEASLAKAEQAIRKQFADDMKAAGVQVPDAGSKPATAGAPGAAGPDTSKMNPVQKIEAGIASEAKT